RTLSRLAGLSLHYLAGLPIRDATTNFRAYSRRVIERFPIESKAGFAVALELTLKAHWQGWRVAEVPTTWHDRTAGRSRFRLFAWLPHYLRWYLRAFWRAWVRRRRGTLALWHLALWHFGPQLVVALWHFGT